MFVESALSRVRNAPFLLDAVRAADSLALAAAQSSGRRTVDTLVHVAHEDDQLAAIAAVHALARVVDDSADAALSDLLSHEHRFLREHAAWAFGTRLPRLDAIGRLVAVVAAGGFAAMLAQRTLERWSSSAPDHVALALEGAVRQSPDVEARAWLMETLGLVPGPLAARVVDQTAADPTEAADVRAAAVAALGDRADDDALALLDRLHDELRRLGSRVDASLLAATALARHDAFAVAKPPAPASADRTSTGATVVQMFLHADIDHTLSRAGAGDNGGIATLLVRLGDALVADERIDRVITVSRGDVGAAVAEPGTSTTGHVLARVPLPASAAGIAASWPSRVAVTRGLRRVLRHAGSVDAFHLRMADVGSLAAQQVCHELGIPTVFSLAPDPHSVVHALDTTGALRRDNFGDVDAVDHHWFRIRLVQRLANEAAHTALFPRPRLRDDLLELVGIDIDDAPGRCTVVPEGIDVGVVDAAVRTVRGGRPDAAVHDLLHLVAALPEHRHDLPLTVSVGRLHRVKGMATVVEAWSSDPDLRDRTNLVIVGGDFEHPSTGEREQLDRIADVVERHPGASSGLVLAGHRSNDVVARWLAVARHGAGAVPGGGAYVCGSLKEEFGLAILEAMAAGLVVVAPSAGGPATYVEPGVTGVLIDTRSPTEVAAGIAAALDMAQRPDIAERVASVVRDRFTVGAMAGTLAEVYATAARPAHRPIASRLVR